MTPAEKKQLGSMLTELQKAVDELMLAGLTAASKSTIERIDVSFKEAARMRLLRLGSNLRIANEEISRFTQGASTAGGAGQFSARRLAFFLGRTWLLAEAMRAALEKNDDAALNQLLATPGANPVEKLKVVTLGVGKRVVPGTVSTFEFRLRAIEDSGEIKKGEALVYSCVFPMRKGQDLPAEAFLHLPQKQKFKPSMLLEKNVVEMTKCAVSRQATSAARLTLTDASEVKAAGPYKEWGSLWKWERGGAAARLAAYKPSPLDLEVELQEEIVLPEWTAGEKVSKDEAWDELLLEGEKMQFCARLDKGPSGNPLSANMVKLAKGKKKPALYGVGHYEGCRVMFQPLATLRENGPEYLTVSPDKISQAELVKAMKFT